MQSGICWGAVVLLVGCWVGCGGGDPNGRVKISGQVRLDGQPLKEGSILFQPLGPDKTTMTGAAIANGTFSLDAKDGAVPGEYQVAIEASDSEHPQKNSLGMTIFPPLILEKYNTKTELKVTVTAAGPNEFKFDLEPMPKPR
jgi:hypothetical protein